MLTAEGFQFLIGKIKSDIATLQELLGHSFQFLIGKIKSFAGVDGLYKRAKFQFLIGKIKSSKNGEILNTFESSFNSS